MSNTIKAFRTTLLAGAAALIAAGAAHAQLDSALQVARQSTAAGAAAQQQINSLADDADNAERQYLAVREQIESERVFVAQQQVFLQSQANELAGLTAQLDRVDSLESSLTPMLLEMFVRLEEFIEQDLQFRIEDRQDRLAEIEELLGDAQVSPAEKYRRLLNAYDIEASYGRSLVSYDEEVDVDGVPTSAKILQIGRVALVRQVRDDYSILTKDNPEWRPVPSSMANDINRAFRIADEVTTPEVFIAPLPGPSAQ